MRLRVLLRRVALVILILVSSLLSLLILRSHVGCSACSSTPLVRSRARQSAYDSTVPIDHERLLRYIIVHLLLVMLLMLLLLRWISDATRRGLRPLNRARRGGRRRLILLLIVRRRDLSWWWMR